MPAVADFVQIARIRDGRPAVEELLVEVDGDRLTIRSEWSEKRQDFKRVAEYRVTETPSGAGRLFRLDRDAEAVESDPDRVTHYWVLIAGHDSRCDCRGFQATERGGRICKHTAAVRWAVAEGLL